jgi:molybdopterin molybdotransferase
MESFFKVEKIKNLTSYHSNFPVTQTTTVSIVNSLNKTAAENIYSPKDIPGFNRSTMDGFAVKSQDTFGASLSSPLILEVKYKCQMGKTPDFRLNTGEAAAIGTGAMLPNGADSVIMIENTSWLNDSEIEIYSSVSPWSNTVRKDDDYKKGSIILEKGTKITKKNIGALASSGIEQILVYKPIKAAIISTGDEIDETNNLKPGKIKDSNRHILSALCIENSIEPVFYGVSPDNTDRLEEKIRKALKECRCVIISGGSSVGTRDITINAIERIEDSKILVHGLAMSPGKPAIIAKASNSPVFGLPGNPVSCFCVFLFAVLPFLKHISGIRDTFTRPFVKAMLTRNIEAAPGRTDFIRVKLINENNSIYALPILGESGLSRTLAECDGLLEIPENKEGGLKGEAFFVHLI